MFVCVCFFCLFLPRMVPCISDYKSHLVGLRLDHTSILCITISSFAFYYQDFQLQVRKKLITLYHTIPTSSNQAAPRFVFREKSVLLCLLMSGF